MRALLALALIVVLAACAGQKAKTPPRDAIEPATTDDTVSEGNVAQRIGRVFVPRRCKTIPRALLQGQAKAEGALTDVDAVATARGAQVDQLSAQLAKIAAAFKPGGCVELAR